MNSTILLGALVIVLLIVVYHQKIRDFISSLISPPLSCIPGQLSLPEFTGKIRTCDSCSDSNTVTLGERHPRLASILSDAEKTLPYVVWADDPHNKTKVSHCMCKPGFSGVDCKTQCPPGLNGPNCATKCSGDLHYYDPRLEMCLCKPGAETEPNGAAQNCFFCSNNTTFDPVNMRCACKEKQNYGDFCDISCPVKADDKAPAGVCCGKNSHVRTNEYTEQSFCVCDDGFGGDNCEKKCPEGRQGRECQFEAECVAPETYQGIPENYYFFGSEEREGNCA